MDIWIKSITHDQSADRVCSSCGCLFFKDSVLFFDSKKKEKLENLELIINNCVFILLCAIDVYKCTTGFLFKTPKLGIWLCANIKT